MGTLGVFKGTPGLQTYIPSCQVMVAALLLPLFFNVLKRRPFGIIQSAYCAFIRGTGLSDRVAPTPCRSEADEAPLFTRAQN